MDLKERFTEEQTIGLLPEAESGLPMAKLCRWDGFSEARYYLWRNNFGAREAVVIMTERAMGCNQLTRILDWLTNMRRLLKAIRSENRKEFRV